MKIRRVSNAKKLAAGSALAAALLAAGCVPEPQGPVAPQPLAATGPSTSVNPYVVSLKDGVEIQSLLTVNDPAKTATNGYKMVGIPDGLGVQAGANGSATVFMNHELGNTAGIARAHGLKGAFISRLSIDTTTHEVTSGQDHVPANGVRYYDMTAGTYTGTPTAWARFCSSDLVPAGHLFNAASGNGFEGSIYLTGEETGAEGRLFGFLEDGTGQELPRFGKLSFENALLANTGTDATVGISTPDSTPGFISLYSGTKTNTGNAFDKAGLTNGSRFAIKATSNGTALANDDAVRTAIATGTVNFELVPVDWNQSGAAQAAAGVAAGATAFTRAEDGAWDPANPNDFYFVTTEKLTPAGSPAGGLWRMHFNDVKNPNAGGKLELLVDGSNGWQKPDNITIDNGVVLIQEDPGNVDYVAGVYAYRIADGKLVRFAEFDQAQFNPTGSKFLTKDEESSGIIPAPQFGAGMYLMDAQVHTVNGNSVIPALGTAATELVEQGQLMLVKLDLAKIFA
jgi:hypothetical protein